MPNDRESIGTTGMGQNRRRRRHIAELRIRAERRARNSSSRHEHWPADHFIKYMKIDCDALCDGKPRGRRHYRNVVFQPYPKPLSARPEASKPISAWA